MLKCWLFMPSAYLVIALVQAKVKRVESQKKETPHDILITKDGQISFIHHLDPNIKPVPLPAEHNSGTPKTGIRAANCVPEENLTFTSNGRKIHAKQAGTKRKPTGRPKLANRVAFVIPQPVTAIKEGTERMSLLNYGQSSHLRGILKPFNWKSHNQAQPKRVRIASPAVVFTKRIVPLSVNEQGKPVYFHDVDADAWYAMKNIPPPTIKVEKTVSRKPVKTKSSIVLRRERIQLI